MWRITNSQKCFPYFFQGSYADYIAVDEEVQTLVTHIEQLVGENAQECKVRVGGTCGNVAGQYRLALGEGGSYSTNFICLLFLHFFTILELLCTLY